MKCQETQISKSIILEPTIFALSISSTLPQLVRFLEMVSIFFLRNMGHDVPPNVPSYHEFPVLNTVIFFL